jgi:hypothetical protein
MFQGADAETEHIKYTARKQNKTRKYLQLLAGATCKMKCLTIDRRIVQKFKARHF